MMTATRCGLALTLLTLSALLAGACGGLGGGGNPLEALAGTYDLTEAFVNQTGNNCNPPPTSSLENVLRVLVDGNEFEARFTDRWSTVKGEIREDGGFLSSGALNTEQTVRFTGEIVDGTLIGTLDHVNGTSCTRTFSVNGLVRP